MATENYKLKVCNSQAGFNYKEDLKYFRITPLKFYEKLSNMYKTKEVEIPPPHKRFSVSNGHNVTFGNSDVVMEGLSQLMESLTYDQFVAKYCGTGFPQVEDWTEDSIPTVIVKTEHSWQTRDIVDCILKFSKLEKERIDYKVFDKDCYVRITHGRTGLNNLVAPLPGLTPSLHDEMEMINYNTFFERYCYDQSKKVFSLHPNLVTTFPYF